MPIIQRPYVPPEDEVPQEESYHKPGETRSAGDSSGEYSDDPITFYCDSMHIFSSLYSSVLFSASRWRSGSPY